MLQIVHFLDRPGYLKVVWGIRFTHTNGRELASKIASRPVVVAKIQVFSVTQTKSVFRLGARVGAASRNRLRAAKLGGRLGEWFLIRYNVSLLSY